MPATLVASVLQAESLTIHFQPIVSLQNQTLVGVEALARPHDPSTGTSIPPDQLFNAAREVRLALELDRLCRRKALANFRPLGPTCGDPLLFINFEASTLETGVLGSGHFMSVVEENGFTPGQVVIEINESKVGDLDLLKDFVSRYRALGFLIALDDLGAGESNLPRISDLKPDIIKLDRSLLSGLQNDFHKREIIHAMVNLGHRLGSVTLAEGVETIDEVLAAADLGVDLFQGYYFARPSTLQSGDLEAVAARLKACSFDYRKKRVQSLIRRRLRSKKHMALLAKLAAQFEGRDVEEFDSILAANLADLKSHAEGAYVLDRLGTQISQTARPAMDLRQTNARLFSPNRKGTDHSLKEYFFSLMEGGLPHFTSAPYLSMATGLRCRTLSRNFRGLNTLPYILCVDLRAEEEL